MLLIKNANLYAPESLGLKDIVIGGGKVLAIEDKIDFSPAFKETWDAQGKSVAPGFIDQHIHLIGAGGKRGFASMSPELTIEELMAYGTTTAVGLLGTDGSTRSVKSLYAKVKALEMEGMSAYMFTGYYGLDPVHITENVQDEMIFIDKVLGCKIAITDIRSSYPTDLELLRLLRQVRVGGMLANKKGILHLHLGNLNTKMDSLFRIVKDHQFPIQHISPTHVGRTKELFDQAIDFAKLGGIIDITTGASQYTKPHLSVMYALEKGASIENMSFSSDGNAGLDRLDENGNYVGVRRAPHSENYREVIALVEQGGLPLAEALKLITSNPARNLGLKNKGRIEVGADADFCVMDDQLQLTEVVAMGAFMMEDGVVTAKSSFA